MALSEEFQKNIRTAIERANAAIARAGRALTEPAVETPPALLPVVTAAPAQPPRGVLGRRVLNTIKQLEASPIPGLFERRPPVEPPPVDLNTPNGRLTAAVRAIVRGATR